MCWLEIKKRKKNTIKACCYHVFPPSVFSCRVFHTRAAWLRSLYKIPKKKFKFPACVNGSASQTEMKLFSELIHFLLRYPNLLPAFQSFPVWIIDSRALNDIRDNGKSLHSVVYIFLGCNILTQKVTIDRISSYDTFVVKVYENPRAAHRDDDSDYHECILLIAPSPKAIPRTKCRNWNI